MGERHVVTGAFGYSGKYIAERLLAEGVEVRTLTNSNPPDTDTAKRISAFPLNFGDVDGLRRTLS